MRPLGDFILVRAHKAGLPTVESIISTSEKSRQTVFTFLAAKTDDDLESTHQGSKESIAIALKFGEWKDLVDAWRQDDIFYGIVPQPSGLRPNSLRDTVEADHYHSVSAARRDNRAGEKRDKAMIPAGLGRKTFVVTLDGDCMEPVYRDGARVIFSVDAFERDGIVDGKSYFLQFEDGSQTFKRVFLDPDDREELILRTYNEKYAERRVRRADVKLMARAVDQLGGAD